IGRSRAYTTWARLRRNRGLWRLFTGCVWLLLVLRIGDRWIQSRELNHSLIPCTVRPDRPKQFPVFTKDAATAVPLVYSTFLREQRKCIVIGNHAAHRFSSPKTISICSLSVIRLSDFDLRKTGIIDRQIGDILTANL